MKSFESFNLPIMLLGEYKHNLDEKGRLAIPVKFRHDLDQGVVVTRGLDNCLFIYTRSEWEKLATKLVSLPISQANSRAFSRLMLSGAVDASLDKQGRVVIPEYLRKFAGLQKSAVIAGLYNRVEVWDEETWNKYKEQTESSAGEIAEKMGELGI